MIMNAPSNAEKIGTARSKLQTALSPPSLDGVDFSIHKSKYYWVSALSHQCQPCMGYAYISYKQKCILYKLSKISKRVHVHILWLYYCSTILRWLDETLFQKSHFSFDKKKTLTSNIIYHFKDINSQHYEETKWKSNKWY